MKAEIITLAICALLFAGYGKFLHGVHTHGIEPIIKHLRQERGYTREQAINRIMHIKLTAWIAVAGSGVVGIAVLTSLIK